MPFLNLSSLLLNQLTLTWLCVLALQAEDEDVAVSTEDDEGVAEGVEQQDRGGDFAHLSKGVVQLTAPGVAAHLDKPMETR